MGPPRYAHAGMIIIRAHFLQKLSYDLNTFVVISFESFLMILVMALLMSFLIVQLCLVCWYYIRLTFHIVALGTQHKLFK